MDVMHIHAHRVFHNGMFVFSKEQSDAIRSVMHSLDLSIQSLLSKMAVQ
jgi:hypothetical protein